MTNAMTNRLRGGFCPLSLEFLLHVSLYRFLSDMTVSISDPSLLHWICTVMWKYGSMIPLRESDRSWLSEMDLTGIFLVLCRQLRSCLCNFLHLITMWDSSSILLTSGTLWSNFLSHIRHTIHTLTSKLHSHTFYLRIFLPYDELYLPQLPQLTANIWYD